LTANEDVTLFATTFIVKILLATIGIRVLTPLCYRLLAPCTAGGFLGYCVDFLNSKLNTQNSKLFPAERRTRIALL